MPRFPVHPQRTSASAAFSNTPRAQAAHFGAGIGRNLAELGSEAAGLGQVFKVREDRQVQQQMSQFDLELAKQRAESDMQAPLEEASEARIERHQSVFDTSAAKLLQGYEGQGLQGRLQEDIEVRRDIWNRKLLAGVAQQRLGESLQDVRGLVEHWAGRVAVDANEFPTASRELLGDEASGEPGLLAGLGLRAEALEAWRGHVLNQLLDAQMQSDPAGLLTDLEAGRWQEALPEERRNSLFEDAEEALTRRESADEIRRKQTSGAKALELSQSIEAGRAGFPDIRRAKAVGTLSASQAEALRADAERAEIALQAQQVAGDELALSLSSGVGFDLANPQNREAADRFYETTYNQAVRAGAPKETLSQVVSMVTKTGYLPSRLARETTGLLLGSDETRQIKGAELYGELREAASELVEDAIELEARAWGGVLTRWLEAGLKPDDALHRADADLPRDGQSLLFDDDERAVLQRDLRSLFYGENTGHRVRRILDRLESNYQDDLAQGLTPREGQARARRDIGRVINKLSLFKAALESNAGAREQGDDNDHPMLHRVNTIVLPGPIPLPIPSHQADDQLSAAAGLELERSLRRWAQRKNDEDFQDYLENMEAIAGWFPSIAASLFGFTMLSIGDGRNLLGKILQEDAQTGIRAVVIDHPLHGRMTIRQQEDISTERYIDRDVTFWDPEKREYVTERLPNSRFFVWIDDGQDINGFDHDPALPNIINPDETTVAGDHTRITPSDKHRPTILPGRPSDPIPMPQLPPSEPGRGRELVPNNTGGNQTDLGPLTESAPGFPAQEQKPQIYVNPDQRGEFPQIFVQQSQSNDDEILKKRGVMLPPERLIAAPTRSGGAPIGDDEYPIELHHPDQDPNKPLVEMTRTEHRLGENYKKNHQNSDGESKIDRREHNSVRRKLYRIDKNNGRFDFFKDEKHPAHPNNRKENKGPDRLRNSPRKKHPKNRRNVR